MLDKLLQTKSIEYGLFFIVSILLSLDSFAFTYLCISETDDKFVIWSILVFFKL